MAKDLTALVALLASMSASEKAEFLASVGVEVKKPKASTKEYVAVRLQLKDTPATAKMQRKAGDMQAMTAKSVKATIDTWVKGKDADANRQANYNKVVVDKQRVDINPAFTILPANDPQAKAFLESLSQTGVAK